jgi:hypothetical protein
MTNRRGTPGRWRRPAALGAVLVVLAAGLAAWWARATVPREDVAAPPAPVPRAAAAAPSTPASAARTPTNVVVPYVEPPPVKRLAALGQQTAADYRRRARYPRSAQPLTDDEADPVARDREVSAVESRGRNGAEPTLRVYPAASGFEAPEPAVVFAELTEHGRPAAAREIVATLTVEDLAPIGDVKFHDDGRDGDAVAGDGRYTAVIDAERLGTKLATSYLVQVVARVDEERRGAASFLYSSPHGRLTGEYRDALVDGSLHVGAEIEVTEAGRFHLEATLYGPDGVEKIAWAQAADWFEPGTHWLDLAFYGLILRERGLDGPYVLRFVALSTTTEMPNAKNRLVENAFWTQAYAASAFTNQPYDDPQLLEAARRIEEDPMPRGLDAGG